MTLRLFNFLCFDVPAHVISNLSLLDSNRVAIFDCELVRISLSHETNVGVATPQCSNGCAQGNPISVICTGQKSCPPRKNARAWEGSDNTEKRFQLERAKTPSEHQAGLSRHSAPAAALKKFFLGYTDPIVAHLKKSIVWPCEPRPRHIMSRSCRSSPTSLKSFLWHTSPPRSWCPSW